MKLNRYDLDIVEETNYFPVSQGWVFQEVIVREDDGELVYWHIPLGPLGGLK